MAGKEHTSNLYIPWTNLIWTGLYITHDIHGAMKMYVLLYGRSVVFLVRFTVFLVLDYTHNAVPCFGLFFF